MAALGFCETEDVREALQEAELTGSLGTSNVEPTIEAVSRWFAQQTNGHWYDSTGQSSDLVETSDRSASNVRLDVPSSPHRRDRQLFVNDLGARYPVTHHGPYARLRLPHLYVSDVAKLEVRDLEGDVDDWVADADISSGRGEDYYLERPGQASYGQTYLYVRAATIGPRVDYSGLLTLEYSYGLDQQSEDWTDVKRGIALASAAQLVTEDDVLTAIPDNGQLVGVDTQRQQLVDDASKHLDPYLEVPVA